MKPIDYRNETFEMVQARGLVNERLQVYEAFRKHGPGTTRAIARASGIDILNLRPRATELYQLGFLKLIGEATDASPARTNEGIYRAFTPEEARAKFFTEKAARGKAGYQPELQL
jgi:hypothetical protein